MKLDELLGKGGSDSAPSSDKGEGGDILSAISRKDGKALKLAIKALVTECMDDAESDEGYDDEEEA
jgi:hypothetical protein